MTKQLPPRWALCRAAILTSMLAVSVGCAHTVTHRDGLDVTVEASGEAVTLRNGQVFFRFDLLRGRYNVGATAEAETRAVDIHASVNEWRTDETGSATRWESRAVTDALGAGQALRIVNHRADRPDVLLEATLYEGRPFVSLAMGVANTTGEAVRVKELHPVAGGQAFGGIARRENTRFLNGDAGNATIRLSRVPGLESCNNLLTTFFDEGRSRSMVLGGLTYADFAKFASAGARNWAHSVRKASLRADMPHGAELAWYMDCGREWEARGEGGEAIQMTLGKSFEYPQARQVADPWFETITWHRRAIEYRMTGLDPGKSYRLGLSWWDFDSSGRRTAVMVTDGVREWELVPPRDIPGWLRGQKAPPEAWFVTLPPMAYTDGVLDLKVVNHNTAYGLNAFVCEMWLYRAGQDVFGPNYSRQVDMDAVLHDRVDETAPLGLALWAEDPLGRHVAPGETYMPDDRFYVDLLTGDPFEALEGYAEAVRMAQGARPNPYTFPTVCGWYVTIPTLGGGPDINNSRELVGEMDEVSKTGFLRYAPVAVRLVPDCYEENNEQGWWDDATWRKFGHLCEPYPTMADYAHGVRDRGGIPLIYVQTGRMSEDYAQAFPEHMLWNDDAERVAEAVRPDGRVRSHDYTDPGFAAHVRDVYRTLGEGGVAGLMFDYPDTGWRAEGGLEDTTTTAAAAYRRIYAMVKEGLGPESYVHERLLRVTPHMPMTDVSVGLVDSQRVWGDTDKATAEMYAKCAGRWYKTRVLYSYDMDAKNLFKTFPDNRDGRRQMLSMVYVTSGRLLMANSFRHLGPEELHDLSRVFPMHTAPKTARPLDLFQGPEPPRVYDFEVDPDWHQLALFNRDIEAPRTIGVSLSDPPARGGMGLDAVRAYHLYDFWNNSYRGRVEGTARIDQNLRPGEVRMLSVHAVEDRPQFIATDRHLMQGYLDLHDVRWNADAHTLTGNADTIEGEPFRIILADNGWKSVAASANGEAAELAPIGADVTALVLPPGAGGPVAWTVQFLPR